MSVRTEAMRLATAAALAALVATPASALSCLTPSLDQTFDWARDADETYGIFVGSVDLNEAKVKSLAKDGTKPFETRAQFSGQSLFADGLTPPFQRDITVRVDCMGAWCGSTQDVENMIFFAKIEPGGEVVRESSPCSNMDYEASDENIAHVVERLKNMN